MKNLSVKSEMLDLIKQLNDASKAYYQGTKEIISNLEYDRLYDRLEELEKATGIIMAGSPTQNVGYEVISALPKEEHEYPMLSLDKTKDRGELASWLGNHKGLLSWKLDGLTVVLKYENGSLVKALTRGNGIIGEVITANAKTFINLPLSIPYEGSLVLRGEAIITYDDFRKINDALPEDGEHYKNPRNLCSGSVRQLNSEITARRMVRFIAFGMVSGPEFDFRSEEMDWLDSQGFETVERESLIGDEVVKAIEKYENQVAYNPYPSDGLVLVLDDKEFGRSLGATAKFPRDAMAFKWRDQIAETILKEILWSASRTGLINPIAIFEPVSLEGTEVSRASLHNVSIMKSLKLGVGDKITVYKANMIIPQVSENLSQSDTAEIPELCPVCGSKTLLKNDNGVMTLHCLNDECPAKSIKRFTLLTGRNALDIDGVSEATLERFIDDGLVKTPSDIFHLSSHKNRIISMEGFGEKSFENLVNSIEKSRKTTASKFLYGLGIPGVGVATAKLIAEACSDEWDKIISLSENELQNIEGIGPVIAKDFVEYFQNQAKLEEVQQLRSELILEKQTRSGEKYFDGLTFVITGKLQIYQNREELKEIIEGAGGKVSGSVSNKTSYLINNDLSSMSGKNKKAKELGISIVDEATVANWIENKEVLSGGL